MSNKTTETSKAGFKQEIGLFGGVSMLGSIMIGGGIFYLGSYVLQRTDFSMEAVAALLGDWWYYHDAWRSLLC